MKKQYLLLLIGILFFGSCTSDNEILTGQPGGENVAPQLIATIEQGDVTKKSGVTEDHDYTQGEKFYWTNGDATTVFFVNSTMTGPPQYKKAEYTANVASGVKSNSCAFDTGDSDLTPADHGEYTAYGFFPVSAWRLEQYYSDFLTVNLPAYQQQSDATSAHLGAYMLMKAQKDVMVDGSTPINLSYTHLASVLRFAVWNNSGNGDLKLAHINVRLNSGKKVFGTAAGLDNIDATSLTIYTYGNVSQLDVEMTHAARDFSEKDGKQQCQGYMAVLPTEADAFDASDDLIIELSLTDGTAHYIVTQSLNIDTDLDFLLGGIEQGKSYYFQLRVDPGDLVPLNGDTYAVGDYWPDNTSPEGIVFWVKPGRFGTQGKVVGLGETYISKWGPDNDEQTAGVTGIRSLIDGATATKNLILKYRESPTFDIDYPAFYYIYIFRNGSNENGVWYLPARDELKALYAGYSGRIYESITNWETDDMPGHNSAECMNARQTFNTKLTTKNGNAFSSNGDWYLSSSEVEEPATSFYSICFEGGSYSSDNKSTNEGYIRWIRNF